MIGNVSIVLIFNIFILNPPFTTLTSEIFFFFFNIGDLDLRDPAAVLH